MLHALPKAFFNMYRFSSTPSTLLCVQVMKETQGDLLPKFTPEEIQLLRSTTIDFFSVNFYCGYYVWAPAPGSPKELVSELCNNVWYLRVGAGLYMQHSMLMRPSKDLAGR